MKNRKFINYGIYIDSRNSYIIAHNNIVHEEASIADTKDIKAICKAIIEKLDDAHRILIFGPSKPKYKLQHEIRKSEKINHISEEVLITEKMQKDEALFFMQKIIPIS